MTKIRLMHRDNMEFMASIPDKHYSLALVDPPYGIGMDNSKKRTKPSRPNSYTSLYPDFRYHKSDWDSAVPKREYFTELFRISKNQIIFGANYFCEFLPNGFGWIFWNKLNGLDNCFSDGEFAFSSKGVKSTYFECSMFNDLKGGKDRIHPTEKPIKLYKWLLQNYATKGDKILDTHGGSMSIAIACADYGYDLDLCELDADYYKDGVNRVKNHLKQSKMFGEQIELILT